MNEYRRKQTPGGKDSIEFIYSGNIDNLNCYINMLILYMIRYINVEYKLSNC